MTYIFSSFAQHILQQKIDIQKTQVDRSGNVSYKNVQNIEITIKLKDSHIELFNSVFNSESEVICTGI